ncbi:MAG: glycosyltransferase family 2 protein [Planctomycetes bacterium]|nr:glycosyltransferase family 2 protein [Planctomycetota bacterium]
MSDGFKLSIVLPVFNEQQFIDEILGRVRDAALPEGVTREIIVVDDCSTDATREKLKEWESAPGFRVLYHEKNTGKGGALHTGFEAVTGEFVLIQDADLEYNPAEYERLLAPIVENRADVVYGSRFLSGQHRRVLYYWHSVMNQTLTRICNMITNLNLSDMEVCYKLIRTDLLKCLVLKEKRFGFEPEVTIKLSRLRPKPVFYEVGISYAGRTYEEGKKIGWKDGVRAVWCLMRYALTRTKSRDA